MPKVSNTSFRVTPANKILASQGIKIKFAISVRQPFLKSEVFFFLNMFSFLKNALRFCSRSVTLEELHDLVNMKFVPRDALLDADEIVFGIDGKQQKITLINKQRKLIQKFINFECPILAKDWHTDYENKLANFYRCNSSLKIPYLRFEDVINVSRQNSTVQITSEYQPRLKKINLFDLARLCDVLKIYLASAKNCMKHADLKIYNIRKTDDGVFFVYDLENLSDQLTDLEAYKVFSEPYQLNRKYSLSAFVADAFIRFKFRDVIRAKVK